MKISCSNCGNPADSTWFFCPECGKKLNNDPSSLSVQTQLPAGDAFDFSAAGAVSWDMLGGMSGSCVNQTLAQQEADSLSAFEVEKHQNGKYAILSLKDRTEMVITVPACVDAIGPSAFEGSEVMTVTLSEGLLKIGERAFADCPELDTINLPATLRVIGKEAFAGCANLDLEIPESIRVGTDALKGTLSVNKKAK